MLKKYRHKESGEEFTIEKAGNNAFRLYKLQCRISHKIITLSELNNQYEPIE